MSTERDELARVILEHDEAGTMGGFALADVLLAAGYRKPQQVTTAEEVEALPNGSVIRDSWDVLVKGGGYWRYGDVETEVQLPATVLHVGGAE